MADTTPYFYQWRYEFWDEIYKGERDSKNNRSGIGEVKWNLDNQGHWRFEDWAREQFSPGKIEYDFDDKLNSDRKLTNNTIVFKGTWKNNYPYGKGEFFLNNKLFFEGNLEDGYIHGKANFNISFITLIFGIYNNHIKIPDYFEVDNEEEYHQNIKTNKDFGKFNGEFKFGLADGYGELNLNSGLSYNGNWSKGYPHGSGTKKYSDGRVEIGEFGILNENTLKLTTEYIEEPKGQLIYGTREFANGDSESVDKRTLIQKAKAIF